MLWRLWLLVWSDQPSKGQTMSPIELFWTAKNHQENQKITAKSKQFHQKIWKLSPPAPNPNNFTKKSKTFNFIWILTPSLDVLVSINWWLKGSNDCTSCTILPSDILPFIRKKICECVKHSWNFKWIIQIWEIMRR